MSTINQSISPLGDGGGGKTLILVRHAKSSWDNVNLSDFERPLNERGKNDAPRMAKRLIDKISIDAFIASPAKRAKKTAELFVKEFGRKEKDIILIPFLYDAPVEAFYQTVSEIDDAFNSVALFSHNPGITSFANMLTTTVKIDNMPTCSVFAVRSDTKRWSDFRNAVKQFLFFDYPKKTTEVKDQ